MAKPRECSPPRVNPKLWTLGDWCWFLNCNKCSILTGDVDGGESCIYVVGLGKEGSNGTVYFPLNFAVLLNMFLLTFKNPCC